MCPKHLFGSGTNSRGEGSWHQLTNILLHAPDFLAQMPEKMQEQNPTLVLPNVLLMLDFHQFLSRSTLRLLRLKDAAASSHES